tara:strand:- start:130 stop:726 length:597 start_codon:yes stop_codon:yes gene_type:complete
MKLLRSGKLPLLVGFCFLASCANVTINVNFPAAEIQKAAEKIEGEVRQGEPAPEGGSPQSFKPGLQFLPTLDWQSAMAEVSVNLDITTPAVRKKVASRKARYPQLKPLLDKGVIGEGKDGLLAIRSLSGIAGVEKVKVSRLVKAENRDRQELFRELARANNISLKVRGVISGAFAKAIRSKMDKGQWYQDDAGKWNQK